MSGEDDEQAELLRKFQAATSGMEVADLRQLAADLTLLGGRMARRSARPELRRPRLDGLKLFRVRVDLDGAEPPIWRRLDLRSDLTLDALHQVLQVTFDWTNSHLHRFSLGGHPFDRTSQLFLCPFDVEEGELDDDGGIPASDVRLDETMQDPGDVLQYVYDYGDSWEITLRLQEVRPAPGSASSAVAVAGDRAAPPEDSGGGTDLASIAMVVDDPARFDLDGLNEALRAPYFMLREYGVNPRLVDLVNRLSYTSIGEDLAARSVALVSEVTRPSDEEMSGVLRAYTWFLDRASGAGIELTSAGYLQPADVEAAAAVVPAMARWFGKQNRENHAAPLLDFRLSLQSVGLLRKYKGTLLLTRAGTRAQRDPQFLWDLLADKLVPTKDGFERDATLLLLLYAASSSGRELPLDAVAEALGQLGWRLEDGQPFLGFQLYRLTALDALENVTDSPAPPGARTWISPAAAALARAALRR